MSVPKVFFRTGYNYDRFAASRVSGLKCEDVSRTVQSEKDDADINVLVRRFGLTGTIPQNVRMPLEADFIEAVDFKTAMNAIREAQESFAAMPADVRARFQNDAGIFVDFCTAQKDGQLVNLEEMRKLGLAVPKAAEPPIPEPMRVRVVADDNKPK